VFSFPHSYPRLNLFSVNNEIKDDCAEYLSKNDYENPWRLVVEVVLCGFDEHIEPEDKARNSKTEH